jgi:hypothetical protein
MYMMNNVAILKALHDCLHIEWRIQEGLGGAGELELDLGRADSRLGRVVAVAPGAILILQNRQAFYGQWRRGRTQMNVASGAYACLAVGDSRCGTVGRWRS